MKELIGEYVVVEVKIDNTAYPFIYNGRLLSIDNMVTLDDIKLGKIVFPLKNVNMMRKMSRIDMIELARKYERWALRLKFEQADEKVKQRFQAVIDAFKGGK